MIRSKQRTARAKHRPGPSCDKTCPDGVGACALYGACRLYSLTPKADLRVYYQADSQRYIDAGDTQILREMPLSRFVAHYHSSASLGFAYDGVAIGGMIFDGRQLHFAVLKAHHGRWSASLMPPTMKWLGTLGRAIETEVEAGNARAIRFLERNGWIRMHRSAQGVAYRLPSTQLARQIDEAVVDPCP